MMRTLQLAWLLCLGLLSSNISEAICYRTPPGLNFKINTGYRQERIDWKMKGSESQLLFPYTQVRDTFEHLNTFLIGAAVKGVVCDTLYVRANGDYGWYTDGVDRQRYHSPFERLRVNNKVRGNNVADISLAVGDPVFFMAGRLLMAPMLGYSYHWQNIRTREVEKFYNLLTPAEAAFEGFVPDSRTKSTYYTSFWAPWVGLDFSYKSCNGWSFYSELEYHFAGRARRERHSHTGLGFFDHYSIARKTYGYQAKIGSRTWSFAPCFMDLYFEYGYWKSRGDSDKLRWSYIGTGVNFIFPF